MSRPHPRSFRLLSLLLLLAATGPGCSPAEEGGECQEAADCPRSDGECATQACIEGQCRVVNAPAGQRVSVQVSGDCLATQCDGEGRLVHVPDDTDLPSDANDCTDDVCEAGVPGHPARASGTSCESAGGSQCDGDGACVACLTAQDCPGEDTECRVRACSEGVCGFTEVAEGTPVGSQLAGDCRLVECDGAGATRSVADDLDLPDDASPCTADACVEGLASHLPLSAGAICGDGLLCNGAGACVGCLTAEDCPGEDTECRVRACRDGVCAFTDSPAGVAVSTQSPGDCRVLACDGAGSVESVIDDTDLPDDGEQCTSDLCTEGVPTHPARPLNTLCAGEDEASYCSTAGECVQCNEDAQCESGVCAAGACMAPSCEDGVQNGDETGPDCGGACPACLPDVASLGLLCSFSLAGVATADCSLTTTAFGLTSSDNVSLIGGQNTRVSVAATDIAWDSAAGVLSFSTTVTNLMAQRLGTIDGVTADAAGIRLGLARAMITGGNGTISALNADGTDGYFSGDLPYFQYDQILQKDETTSPKTVRLNVPASVGSFSAYFLLSTKAEVKLVINEILVNPGGAILDPNGEWFEIHNAGLFPVNMEGFRIGDSAGSGDRPLHVITTPGGELNIEPEGYLVFGNSPNTTNNGGVRVDYSYWNALSLANSLDAVRLVSPAGFVKDVPNCGAQDAICEQTNFVELQRVRYASASISAQDGISRELVNPGLNNSNIDSINWANASVTAVYGPGGRGTPGARNSTFVP